MSHNLRSTLLKLTAFTVFSLLLTSIVFNSLLNSSQYSQVSYSADFTNASGLRQGNSVRIAGVQVGKITDVRLRGEQARVTFKLDDNQRPTSTTKAAINYANLLGQRFVNLLPGETAGEPLRAGAVIPIERTAPALDLTAVFDGFQPLFSALSPDAVNKLAASVVQVFQGQAGTVESLFQQTAVITRDLAGRQQLIDSVLTNLAGVLTQVGTQNQQLGALVENFDRLFTGLADDRAALGAAVTGLADLTTGIGGLLNQAQPALNRDITALGTVTQTLVAEQGALDGVIQRLPDILATFTKPISAGSYLNAYLCNLTVNLTQGGVTPADGNVDLSISLVPGVAAQGLYPNPVTLPATTRIVAGAGTPGSEVCR